MVGVSCSEDQVFVIAGYSYAVITHSLKPGLLKNTYAGVRVGRGLVHGGPDPSVPGF